MFVSTAAAEELAAAAAAAPLPFSLETRACGGGRGRLYVHVHVHVFLVLAVAEQHCMQHPSKLAALHDTITTLQLTEPIPRMCRDVGSRRSEGHLLP
jgi:hypothetical protein